MEITRPHEHRVPTGPDDPRLSMKWEAIEQIGTDWAWSPQANHKPKEWILNTLIDCVAMGGNLMVGVSPMANGKFPGETIERLGHRQNVAGPNPDPPDPARLGRVKDPHAWHEREPCLESRRARAHDSDSEAVSGSVEPSVRICLGI